MNVTAHPNALVLFDAAQPARKDLHSGRDPALRVVTSDGELRNRVGDVASPPGTGLVPARTDHFSRSGASDALVNDGSYGDPRTSRRSVIRQYLDQNSNDLTARNQIGLYAQVQGASTGVVKGAHIDVFA